MAKRGSSTAGRQGAAPDGRAHADLAERVQTFLGEFRMVIPALGAFLGFQLTSAFSASYKDLSTVDKVLDFAGLCATALALLALLVPASYHRFLTQLDASREFLAFARICIETSFVFMPIAFSCAIAVQASRTFSATVWGLVAGGLFLLLYAVGWWLVPWLRAREFRQRHGTE